MLNNARWDAYRVMRAITARLLWKTAICRRLAIDLPDVRLRFHPSAMSCMLWAEPNSYSDDVSFIRQYLAAGDRFIDVGANIGYFTIVAALRAGPGGSVISIEPNQAVFGYLTANVALNRLTNVELHNLALGAHCGESRLRLHPRDDTQSRIDSTDGQPVLVRRLDDVVEDRNPVSLIKIDVEGYEKQVIEGGPKTLGRADCVYLESWETQYSRYGATCGEVLQSLRKLGFEVYRRTGERIITRCAGDYSSDLCENLIGIRDIDQFISRTDYAVC